MTISFLTQNGVHPDIKMKCERKVVRWFFSFSGTIASSKFKHSVAYRVVSILQGYCRREIEVGERFSNSTSHIVTCFEETYHWNIDIYHCWLFRDFFTLYLNITHRLNIFRDTCFYRQSIRGFICSGFLFILQ